MKEIMRKHFKHTLVPRWELTTENIDGCRYYVLPDGTTKLKSVTTILSNKLDKTSLLEWKAKVGEDVANRISEQAKRRGNAIHTLAEKYVLNEDHYSRGAMPINLMSFNPIKKVLDQHVDDIMGVELPLWSKALGAAGRTDLVAHYDGKGSIIDFKTSKRPKEADWIESYFLQSTIYSMMFERLYAIAVPQIVIIITVDDEPEAQTFIKNRADYVNRAIEILTN